MSEKKVFRQYTVRGVMGSVGADLVSREAVKELIEYLTEETKAVMREAAFLLKRDKRKKLSGSDITTAIKLRDLGREFDAELRARGWKDSNTRETE